jgi:formiminoglutamase
MGKNTTVDWSLSIATSELINASTIRREGETKLGEKLITVPADNWQQTLKESKSKYVIVGIPEDIGVRANNGIGGAHTLWEPFLKAFCNLQQTDTLNGESIVLLGAFDFSNWMEASLDKDLTGLREMVSNIDEAVYPVIEAITTAGKLPIVIGGGHNNCYPIIKGVSKGLNQSINCINLDAHSDFRMMEGRHSGNGFRYAKAEGYLSHYAIAGLHRNYNSQSVLNDIQNTQGMNISFFEDIFLKEQTGFNAAIQQAIDYTAGVPTGIELDLDCIERVLSSAITPSGITSLQARQYMHHCSLHTSPAYLHLTEGAVTLRDGRTDNSVARLVAYLVSDFVRASAAV